MVKVTLRRKIQQYFGEDALYWADRSYAIDCSAHTERVVAISFWLFAGATNFFAPVYERVFDIHDPLISFPHRKDQISSFVNHIIAFWVPVGIVSVAGFFRRSFVEIHHGMLALVSGKGLATLVTVLLKHRVGRLRPDFLARCKWDNHIHKCTGAAHAISGGRKSFPSGHSSTAFAGMTFLSLWIAGHTTAWCFGKSRPIGNYRSSRLANLSLTLIPLAWAAFVAITRLEDYKHHKEDIIAGSLIGLVAAVVCYLAFWPNPFSANALVRHLPGHPRIVYASDENRPDNVEFQLTSLEMDGIDNV